MRHYQGTCTLEILCDFFFPFSIQRKRHAHMMCARRLRNTMIVFIDLELHHPLRRRSACLLSKIPDIWTYHDLLRFFVDPKNLFVSTDRHTLCLTLFNWRTASSILGWIHPVMIIVKILALARKTFSRKYWSLRSITYTCSACFSERRQDSLTPERTFIMSAKR